MASLYARSGSVFWWIKFRNPLTGKIVRQSTKFRRGIESESRKARKLRDEKSLAENRASGDVHLWREWVEPFLRIKHANSPRTLQRKLVAWRTVLDFLDANEILGPAHLTREHCVAFMDWRMRNGFFQLKHRRRVAFNTALFDIKTLSSVMWEAVARQYVTTNPCQRLGFQRQETAQRPEMTDEQIAFIRSNIARKLRTAKTDDAKRNADFLNVSFEIALLQGMRLESTRFRLSCVDFDNMQIKGVRVKGNRYVDIALNPAAVPLFKRLVSEGREYTYNPPRMPSLNWWKFFNKLRRKMPSLKRVSLHCTRHTLTSRIERGGLPEPVAMKMLSHLSHQIHRDYRNVKPSEVEPYWKHVAYGAAPVSQPCGSETQGCPGQNPKQPLADSGDRA